MRVCGFNSVMEALKAKKVQKIYYSDESGKVREILEIARREKIPCYRTSMREKICAEISPVSFSTVDEMVSKAIMERGTILLLDNVSDPQNLGACIRTAEFFGCSGVIIKKWRAAGITEGVLRASAGAVFHIKIAREDNLTSVVKKLKKMGLFIVAADLDGEDIRRTILSPPAVLVVGGEDRGISKGIKRQCDLIVRIPGTGNVKSLNLSVACGIVMFELFKNRPSNA